MATNTPTFFPNLPIVCLATAQDLTTHDVIQGKMTVIDFWTTKCTRCPAALDDMNKVAALNDTNNIQFVSICCDRCDGAREIIDQEQQPRWSNMRHYYMQHHDKEHAKQILGFTSVPYYVVLDINGKILQRDNTIAWESIPNILIQESDCKENIAISIDKANKAVDLNNTKLDQPLEERVFVLDDLDF